MKQPIHSGGEAMPDPSGLVLDAKNILSEIKHLNEAIFLAAHGLGDRHHMNAITTVADIIEDKISEVDELLDCLRRNA
ncbi:MULTISPECIES: hypothetical protein [unclassified Rhizobium]|uniref:hypothetical protein n=1 Tax=unclassified Rhizobium TaxID=2613769 RepID=UPI00381E823F